MASHDLSTHSPLLVLLAELVAHEQHLPHGGSDPLFGFGFGFAFPSLVRLSIIFERSEEGEETFDPHTSRVGGSRGTWLTS